MDTRQQKAAQKRAMKVQTAKLVLLSFFTLGIGGWFAIKQVVVGILAILAVFVSLPLMFFGVGFVLLAVVWLGSTTFMSLYPYFARVGAVFNQIENQADQREQLGAEGAGAI